MWGNFILVSVHRYPTVAMWIDCSPYVHALNQGWVQMGTRLNCNQILSFNKIISTLPSSQHIVCFIRVNLKSIYIHTIEKTQSGSVEISNNLHNDISGWQPDHGYRRDCHKPRQHWMWPHGGNGLHYAKHQSGKEEASKQEYTNKSWHSNDWNEEENVSTRTKQTGSQC